MSCCVIGCSNSYVNTKGKGIAFYSFPGKPYQKERKEKWINNIRRITVDGTPWQPTKNSRVCSEHFISKKKSEHPAHPDYVPTVFPYCYKKKKSDGIKRIERFQRLQNRKKENVEKVCETHLKPHQVERTTSMIEPERLLTAPLGTPRLEPGAEPGFPIESLSTPSSPREGVADESQLLEITLIDAALENSTDTMSADDRLVDNTLCRICGRDESDLTSLYGPSAIEMGLLRKIEDNLKIKIDRNGCLPTQICKECISKLDICDRFINLARNANIRLHEMYAGQLEKISLNDPPTVCQYCDKKFRSPTLLNLHLSTHSTAALFLCEFCGSTFKSAEGLICHKRTHRDLSKKKKHACSSCDKTFRSRFDLLEHTNWHSGARPYSCSRCGKTFHRRAQLRQHSLVHRAGTMLKNSCVKCGKVFARYSDLRMHMRRHEIGRTFKCGVCSLSFSSINVLLSHRKKHQSNTNSNSEMQHSTKTPTKPGSEGKFGCDGCGKQLSSRSALSYHRKAFHSGSKDWRCEQCGKTFVSEGLKRIHERTHSAAEPFQCTVCNKSFKSPNVLNQHLKDHSSTSAFECPHCHKQFKRKGALSVHVRVHTGQRPFACNVCARRFAQKNDMLKHVARQHTQKTIPPQFSCEFCSCTFNDSAELEEHKERIHILTIDFEA